MKKIFSMGAILLVTLLLTACGSNTSGNVEGSLEDIVNKLYVGVEEDLPMMMETHELTEENFEFYAFVKDVNYKEAVFSEPMMGSIPHSVVLIRLEDEKDAEKVAKEIKENADPRKWICVEAKNVYTLTKGNLVALIMVDNKEDEDAKEIGPTIKSNFEKLK